MGVLSPDLRWLGGDALERLARRVEAEPCLSGQDARLRAEGFHLVGFYGAGCRLYRHGDGQGPGAAGPYVWLVDEALLIGDAVACEDAEHLEDVGIEGCPPAAVRAARRLG
jgi:hypothetical protein